MFPDRLPPEPAGRAPPEAGTCRSRSPSMTSRRFCRFTTINLSRRGQGIFVRAGAQYQKDREKCPGGRPARAPGRSPPPGTDYGSCPEKHRIRRKLGHRLAYQGVLRLDEPVIPGPWTGKIWRETCDTRECRQRIKSSCRPPEMSLFPVTRGGETRPAHPIRPGGIAPCPSATAAPETRHGPRRIRSVQVSRSRRPDTANRHLFAHSPPQTGGRG